MAKLNVQQIRDVAKSIIASSPNGIRYSELVSRIATGDPETEANTIHGTVVGLVSRFPTLIHKPSRGLFAPIVNNVQATTQQTPISPPSLREAQFYDPFAQWLKDELGEVTVAAALGGNGIQKKWGTPDVVGVYKPLASHRIRFGIEIVSAEIKIDPSQSVVAFGQAVAYRLFSAKSYIVMPNTIANVDYDRLESLCVLFGIGLVTFDLNPQLAAFSIKVRAQRVPPDMFYVNEFADSLHQTDASTFNDLFA